MASRPLAVVTGASTGIGYELARAAAEDGCDLVMAADEPAVHDAANRLRSTGSNVQSLVADLSTRAGVRTLYDAADDRPVDVLMANAGRGLGGAFLDQEFADVRHVIDTNITGTIDLIQMIGRDMRARHHGQILITGSIAGFIPGTFAAVYNASKAFLDSFAFALRAELKDSGVTVTCLMPGPTETAFFERAGMVDTAVGQAEKDDPTFVARLGYEAMKKGEADIVTGWKNKLQTAVASVTPAGILAEQHRRQAEPDAGRDR